MTTPVNPDATQALVTALCDWRKVSTVQVCKNIAEFTSSEGIRFCREHMVEFRTRFPSELRTIAPVVPVSEEDRDACELIDKAVEIMRIEKKASVSLFQRRVRLGYVRASCLMDTLSKLGLVQRVDVSSSLVFSVNEEKLGAYGKPVSVSDDKHTQDCISAPVSEDVETIRKCLESFNPPFRLVDAHAALDRLAAAAGRKA